MNKVNLLMEAISFSARAHSGQKRKDKQTPYASHPFRVCMTLRHVFGVEDELVLAAAVLHDTIEDTTTDYDDVKKYFSDEIATWVGLLSKDKRKEETQREEHYFEQLRTSPLEVKLIKLADAYDNLIDSPNAGSGGHVEKTLNKCKKYIETFKDEKNPRLIRAIEILEDVMETIAR